MSITRKDYQLIAAALREADADVDTVAVMAHRLGEANANFNLLRFVEAATGEAATVAEARS